MSWVVQLSILAALLTTLLTALSGTRLPRLALLLLTGLLATALLATLLAALLLLIRLRFVLLHSTSFPSIKLPGHRLAQRAATAARSRFCYRQNMGTSAVRPVFLPHGNKARANNVGRYLLLWLLGVPLPLLLLIWVFGGLH